MANSDASADQPALPRRSAPSALLATFIVLWITWAVLLAAAMILGNPQWGRALGLASLEISEGHRSIEATAARMGSSLVLVVVGWLAAALWRGLALGRFAWCIAIGMTAGTIGDFFNAGLLEFVPLVHGVLGGIVSFGLGHIAYIAGCIDLAKRSGLTARTPIAAAVIAWQLVALVGWYFVVVQGTEARPLVGPALPYSLLLAGTAAITGGLALQDRRLFALALGAALFLASDLILACELFRGHFAYDTELVWLTYGPGQMLIVFSTISAALVVRSRGR
jgi:uncharacterized membrane protein YhhN